MAAVFEVEAGADNGVLFNPHLDVRYSRYFQRAHRGSGLRHPVFPPRVKKKHQDFRFIQSGIVGVHRLT
jgi:hypothetical protein